MKQGFVFMITGVISITIMTVLGVMLKINTSPDQPAEDVSSQIQQTFTSREATYQAIIADANQRLGQANADLQTLSAQLSQLQQTQTISTETSGQSQISPEQAVEIANEVTNDVPLNQTAELVDFEGAIAYEVLFSAGPVYVDAVDGKVLYNSLQNSSNHQITHEEAVKIASDYLGIEGIYLVDEITFQGRILIRIIFTQGHMVYLNQGGQIVYVQKVTHYDPNNITTVSSSSDSGSSSDRDDHEEREDDDDDDDD